MIKINDSEGRLFGVFKSRLAVMNYLESDHYIIYNDVLKQHKLFETEDTVPCHYCANDIDEDFVEHDGYYYCQTCWDKLQDQEYKEDSQKMNKDFYRER